MNSFFGSHLQKVILYGSYARGDFRTDSDIDIMILLDMSDLDIKPIAKSKAHFEKWIENYPFYSNIHKEGVVLYGTA